MSTLQKGDIVLVTGATGFVGGHVVEELIAAGFKVRGTCRSHAKAKHIIDYINEKFGHGKLEIVEVPDMIVEGAYNEVVKGISGIVHLASVTTFSAVPDEVIPPSVKGTVNILQSALLEPKIKSLVYTSSSAAAYSPCVGKKMTITEDSWNDAVLEEIRTSPTPFNVYFASKVEAERALWKTIKEINPPFRVNSILPHANFGSRFKESGNSTGDWVVDIYNGNTSVFGMPPPWFVNVSDDAKLHVAALVDPACDGERVFAFAAPIDWNDILAVLRKLEPGRKFAADVETGKELTEVPNKKAEELLRKHYGHGWTSLEETVKQGLARPAS